MSDMHTYRLGIKGLDMAFRAGTNLMLIGPPMSGKGAIFDSIVAGGLASGEMVILLSTMETGESILGRFHDVKNLRVIDCMSGPLGLSVPETQSVIRVSGPMDLTGIGVGLSQLLEAGKGNGHVRLCIDSVSTLLMYSSLQAVFRFMHVIAGRVTVSGALGVYVVEEGMHDSQTLATLKQLFSAIIEVKVENGAHQMRLTGPGVARAKWREFEIIDGRAEAKGNRK